MPITTTPSGGPQGEFSTYTPIYATTLSSATSSITFSNITNTFTELVLVCSTGYTSTNIGQGLSLRFNDDSATNYSSTIVEGDGSSGTSYRGTSQTGGGLGAPSNGNQSSLTPMIISIQNYSSTTNFKTWISRCSGPTYIQVTGGLWREASKPVTSITIFAGATATNIKSGSTFTLYGIKAATPAAKATGGDLVVSDGSFWYHVFRNSGRLETTQAITANYLVIAGGGGGVGNAAFNAGPSGGGAGGLRSTVTATGGGGTLESALSLASMTGYSVIVGAGGAGGNAVTTGITQQGEAGNGSSFSTVTTVGGGGGATGATGGSGGGANYLGGTINNGTANQGYRGGSQTGNPIYSGGGGGGAGAVGGNAGTDGNSNGGVGGAGVLISALATPTGTGVSGYYAGGGGGGGYFGASDGQTFSGGAGGGGYGAFKINALSGTANTGGGGGGAAGYSVAVNGGNGGSGLVIVRYPV
jgi:hypothetical protein